MVDVEILLLAIVTEWVGLEGLREGGREEEGVAVEGTSEEREVGASGLTRIKTRATQVIFLTNTCM